VPRVARPRGISSDPVLEREASGLPVGETSGCQDVFAVMSVKESQALGAFAG
jgi:hypothetical protein